jgi:hypothetical protein
MGASETFEIWTDHKNLQYFRKPQKLNRRQARWMTELSEYHYNLLHKPGKTHGKPDGLSRQPDLKKGEDDNENVILLKEEHFRQHSLESFKATSPPESKPLEEQRTELSKKLLQVKRNSGKNTKKES